MLMQRERSSFTLWKATTINKPDGRFKICWHKHVPVIPILAFVT
jgi:hypothetical protein